MSLLLLLKSSSGTTNYSLSCSAGSYTYTGKAATLNAARSMPGAAGSYVYTGKAATFAVALSLPAVTGSYVYTGKPTSFVYNPLSSNKGSFSDYKFTRKEKERLARLRMQQSRIRDDEEALAIILAAMLRRN